MIDLDSGNTRRAFCLAQQTLAAAAAFGSGIAIAQAQQPTPAPASAGGRRPNILFVMGDDIGWLMSGGRVDLAVLRRWKSERSILVMIIIIGIALIPFFAFREMARNDRRI